MLSLAFFSSVSENNEFVLFTFDSEIVHTEAWAKAFEQKVLVNRSVSPRVNHRHLDLIPLMNGRSNLSEWIHAGCLGVQRLIKYQRITYLNEILFLTHFSLRIFANRCTFKISRFSATQYIYLGVSNIFSNSFKSQAGTFLLSQLCTNIEKIRVNYVLILLEKLATDHMLMLYHPTTVVLSKNLKVVKSPHVRRSGRA